VIADQKTAMLRNYRKTPVAGVQTLRIEFEPNVTMGVDMLFVPTAALVCAHV
jgi:hypothetical protein